MKKYVKIFAIVIWIIVAFLVVDSAFAALSVPNTILNIVGLLGLVIFGFISYASKCFTSWKSYNKKLKINDDEKSN